MKCPRWIPHLLLAAALVWPAVPSTGEELLLKNGQKIVGTIVGYENDMFRVETEYGIALVRKDKVASILVSKPEEPKTGPELPKRETTKGAEEKPATSVTAPAAPVPSGTANQKANTENPSASSAPTAAPLAYQPPPATVLPATVKPAAQSTEGQPHPAPAPGTVAAATSPAAAGPGAKDSPPIAGPNARTVAAVPPPQPPPPPASHPLDVPLPPHLAEHVDGNTFFSDTFHFSMFKPPDWKIYEGVPKETGSGIMAMGTEDEQTLLIVDRQVWSGKPNLSSDEVEAKLRQTYQDYRRISEETFACDGQPAIRRTFTGVMDGAEWHGVAVHVIHGNMVFGIIGLTSAETFQFQEAIFTKIVKTFHAHTPHVAGEAANP